MPAPRIKKKQKLASIKNATNKDKNLQLIVPPKRKHKSKSSVDLEIIINNCQYNNDKDQNEDHIINNLQTDNSTLLTNNHKSVNGVKISVSERDIKQPINIILKEEKDFVQVNHINSRHEEHNQYDSGVYLPESVSSGNPCGEINKDENVTHSVNIITHDNDNTVKDRLLEIPTLTLSCESQQSDMKNKISAKDEMLQSIPVVPFATTEVNIEEIVNIVHSPLPTKHTTVTPIASHEDSHIEHLIHTTVSRISTFLDCKDEENISSENDLYTDSSPFGISILLDKSSNNEDNVFHESKKDASANGSPYGNNILQLLISKEPVPGKKSFGSSISLLNISCNNNHFEEESDIWPNGLDFFKNDETDNSTCIIKDVTDLEHKDSDTFVSNENKLIVKNETNTGEDCCLYSALDRFEANNTSEQAVAAIENEGQLAIDNEKNSHKNRFYKTCVGEDVHPKKISKSFDLFIKNMLMDGEEHDLNYHGDNSNFKSSLNEIFNNVTNQVTNLTDDNNEIKFCEELSNNSKASPRCINVECDLKAGLVSDIDNQLSCDSEIANSLNGNSCALSVISVNTTVPSFQESCQSPLYTVSQEKSVAPIGSEGNNTIVTDSTNEDSISSLGSESGNLPCFGGAHLTDVSRNNPLNQFFSSQVPVIVKVKGKPLKRNALNDDFLDSFEEKLENRTSE